MKTANQLSNINPWVLSLYVSGLTVFLQVPFLHVAVPLLIWACKKQAPEVDRHGRNVLNFNITYAGIQILLIIAIQLLMPKTAVDLVNNFGQMPTGLIIFGHVITVFFWAYLGLLAFGGFKAYQGDFFRLPGQQKLFKEKVQC